jgi:hypothetical protein
MSRKTALHACPQAEKKTNEVDLHRMMAFVTTLGTARVTPSDSMFRLH